MARSIPLPYPGRLPSDRRSFPLDGTELEALAQQARRVISDADPNTLRKDDGVRGVIENKLTEIKGAVEQLIVNAPRRRFAFDVNVEDCE